MRIFIFTDSRVLSENASWLATEVVFLFRITCLPVYAGECFFPLSLHLTRICVIRCVICSSSGGRPHRPIAKARRWAAAFAVLKGVSPERGVWPRVRGLQDCVHCYLVGFSEWVSLRHKSISPDPQTRLKRDPKNRIPEDAMRTAKISACQFPIARGGFDHFRTRIEAAMAEVPRDSDYVLFPELFTVGLVTSYPDASSLADLTRIVEFTPRYRELFHQIATSRKQFVLAGSHLEKQGDLYFNVAHLFTPEGRRADPQEDSYFPCRVAVADDRGRHARSVGRRPSKSGRRDLLRNGNSRGLPDSRLQWRRNDPVSLVHVFRGRLLARQTLRPGAVHREPDLPRPLLHDRRRRRAASAGLRPQFDPQPLRPGLESERHRR